MRENKTQPQPYTFELEKVFNEFVEKFQKEIEVQKTKTNKVSERRMRVLLRQFYKQAYFPYREQTRRRTNIEDIINQ